MSSAAMPPTTSTLLRFLWDRAVSRLPRLALASLISLLCIASGAALLATSGYLIQQASTQPPVLSLEVAVVGVRLFALLRATSRYLERLATHDAVLRLLEDTRVAVFEAVEPRTPAAYDHDRSGDLMRRISTDVEALQDFYARSLLPPVTALAVILIATLIASLLAGALGATIGVAMTALALVIILAASLTGRGAADRIATLSGTLVAEITDTLQGCADLIGIGAVDDRLRHIDVLQSELCQASRRLGWSRALATGLVSLATGATVVATVIAATMAVQAGLLPAMAVGILAMAGMALSEPFALLPTAVDAARSGAASGRRLLSIMDRPLPVAPPVEARSLPEGSGIDLRDVCLTYAPGQPPALDHVSFRLRRGERVGVIGPSGSGKSTLASVLVRFRSPDQGSYTLDGVDTVDLEEDQVRERVGLVSQDAHIFATSIRENLRLARTGATQDELDGAARRAHLLKWIEELPEGWDTRVGEHGAQISGGQRRRLALARALLADFPVLVVDEPTEALDTETAAAVIGDIVEATRGRSLVLISHRQSDVQDMDSVYAMHDGRLALLSAPSREPAQRRPQTVRHKHPAVHPKVPLD